MSLKLLQCVSHQMKRPIYSFSLSTFFAVLIGLSIFSVLNLRPSYSDMLETEYGMADMAGDVYQLYNIRKYGWPLGCVESHLRLDLGNADIGVFKEFFAIQGIHWWKLSANVALLFVGGYVLVRLCK